MERIKTLSEDQLEKDVIVWREDEAVSSLEPMILHDDHYIAPDDEDGCYTLSDAGLDIEDVKEKNLKKVYDKGHPILAEDF